MENIELPEGWAPGWGTETNAARGNLTWRRLNLALGGACRPVVSFNWAEDKFRVYLVTFEQSLAFRHMPAGRGQTMVRIADGSPAFDDPVAAMIWAEVEYG